MGRSDNISSRPVIGAYCCAVVAMSEVHEIDEEMIPVTEAEAKNDKYYRCLIAKEFNRQIVRGEVKAIEIGEKTNERLYYVEYEDNEAEHITEDEVKNCLVSLPKAPVPAAAQDHFDWTISKRSGNETVTE